MGKRPRKAARAPKAKADTAHRPVGGVWPVVPVWILVLAVPLVSATALQNAFRLPKLLVASALVAVSFAALAWRIRGVERVDWKALARRPVVLVGGLLLAAAGTGLVTSDHPAFVRQTLVPFALAVLALVIWEAAITRREHRALILGLLIPGAILALVGVLQYHEIRDPFRVLETEGSRLTLTSFAGGPFDLSAFLVLPVLIAQGVVAKARGWRQWLTLGLLALMLYVVALTQTLSSFAAVAVGSMVLWSQLIGRRRLIGIVAGAAALGALAWTVSPQLRQRASSKIETVRSGDWNDLLSGRLDCWRAGVWMIEQEPIFGVGHGAFRGRFGEARLALTDEGVTFYLRQQQPFFENPHSDFLTIPINWGLFGAALFLVAFGVFAKAAWRAWRAWRAAGPEGKLEAAVVSAIVVSMAVQMTAAFPLHLAMVAFPFVLVASAVFRQARMSEEAPV